MTRINNIVFLTIAAGLGICECYTVQCKALPLISAMQASMVYLEKERQWETATVICVVKNADLIVGWFECKQF